MSNKNSLKDKIKKPNATQTFFNSYDDNTNNNDNNESDNELYDVVTNDTNKDNTVEDKDITYVNNNVNNNTVVDVNKGEDDDYLRGLAAGKKTNKKKVKKVFTSFYMDPDLAIEVNSIASRGEKGDKSKLINLGIRKLLEEYNVINKK